MTTLTQDRQFRDSVIASTLLDESIAWINDNLTPDEVFDEDLLRQWALDSGFVEKTSE